MLKRSRKILSNTSSYNNYASSSTDLGNSHRKTLHFRFSLHSNNFEWKSYGLRNHHFWSRHHDHGTELQSILWFGNHIKFLTNYSLFMKKGSRKFSNCAVRSIKIDGESFALKMPRKDYDSSTEGHTKMTIVSKKVDERVEKAYRIHGKCRRNLNDDLESQIILHLDLKKEPVNTDLRTRILDSIDQKDGKFIEPEQILLHNPAGGDDKHFTYVPLLKTLKLMMENEDVQRLCGSSPHKSTASGYFDICDGEVIKKNEFFCKNSNALKIVLTQDMFESWIPIGTQDARSKLIVIYMTLANLPPNIRNRIHNMKLVLLCLKEHVDEFGWSAVLQRLVSDLRQLETTGISYSVSGRINTIKGSLVAVTGDNRACNWIGGFTKNFAQSEYFSRYCEYTLSELRRRTFCRDKIRTVKTYNDCISQIERTGKVVKGIKMNSPLNSLNHFHVCNPGLPPCADYDIFTGFARHDLLLATFYLIKKKWISLDSLNERLQKIKLTPEIRLRFPKMKERYICGQIEDVNKIKLLIMVYPIAIANSIKDYNDDVWRMILRLRQICDLVNSPALTSEQVNNLDDIIVHYLKLRVTCFPTVPLKPKHLFIQHYPRMIRKFGPLRHLLSFGFDYKHKYMRSIIRSCESYDNITDTVADIHELIQSSLSNQYSEGTVIDDLCENNCKDVKKSFRSTVMKLAQKVDQIEYFRTKIHFRGITYERNMHVCVGIDERCENLLVCKIDTILMNKEKTNVYFVGKVKTVRYDCDIGVYKDYDSKELNRKESFRCYPYSSLISFDPLLQSRLNSEVVYVTQYTPFGKIFE